ncbi:MAG: hypothetical protein IPG76_08865 [Acidobacteria bacterium]|nr:hypothetical protein [Acidobacteriota bacterium]
MLSILVLQVTSAQTLTVMVSVLIPAGAVRPGHVTDRAPGVDGRVAAYRQSA